MPRISPGWPISLWYRLFARAAHARLDRLNRTCPETDEVIKVVEEYWKEAAESLRDFQEE
jgi:hypothetical protein